MAEELEVDKYLSEIHSSTTFTTLSDTNVAVSRFKLSLPSKEKLIPAKQSSEEQIKLVLKKEESGIFSHGYNPEKSSVDEDGDFVLERKSCRSDVLETILLNRELHIRSQDPDLHSCAINDSDTDDHVLSQLNSNDRSEGKRNDRNEVEGHGRLCESKSENIDLSRKPEAMTEHCAYKSSKNKTLSPSEYGHKYTASLSVASPDDCEATLSSDGECKACLSNYGHSDDKNSLLMCERRLVLKRKLDSSPAGECDDYMETQWKYARMVSVDPDEDYTSPPTEDYFINIKHSLATDLQLVGEQVWSGALLLCDFIIHQKREFQQKCVVDLGSGTGLTSIVAALYARRVYCTDTGDSILKLAADNVQTACDCPTLPADLCPVHVKDVDWFSSLSTSDESRFGLTEEDIAQIKNSEVLIAADVIYDNDITDAFFSMVTTLMSYKPNKVLYIGLEKRFVFTVEDLDITTPGYNHFRKHLELLQQQQLQEKQPQQQQEHQQSPEQESHHKSRPSKSITFTVEQIGTDYPQYLHYNRTRQLELWKISSLAATSELSI